MKIIFQRKDAKAQKRKEGKNCFSFATWRLCAFAFKKVGLA
jgi:hypothetical protein